MKRILVLLLIYLMTLTYCSKELSLTPDQMRRQSNHISHPVKVITLNAGALTSYGEIPTSPIRAFYFLNMLYGATASQINDVLTAMQCQDGFGVQWLWHPTAYDTYDKWLDALEWKWTNYFPTTLNSRFRDPRLASPFMYQLLKTMASAVTSAGGSQIITDPGMPPFTSQAITSLNSGSHAFVPIKFHLTSGNEIYLTIDRHVCSALVWRYPTSISTYSLTTAASPTLYSVSDGDLVRYYKFLIRLTNNDPNFWLRSGTSIEAECKFLSDCVKAYISPDALDVFQSIATFSGVFRTYISPKPFKIDQVVSSYVNDLEQAQGHLYVNCSIAAQMTSSVGTNMAMYSGVNDTSKISILFDKVHTEDRSVTTQGGIVLSSNFEDGFAMAIPTSITNTPPYMTLVTLLNETLVGTSIMLVGSSVRFYYFTAKSTDNVVVNFHGVIPPTRFLPARINTLVPNQPISYVTAPFRDSYVGNVFGPVLAPVPHHAQYATIAAFIKGRTTTTGQKVRLTSRPLVDSSEW